MIPVRYWEQVWVAKDRVDEELKEAAKTLVEITKIIEVNNK